MCQLRVVESTPILTTFIKANKSLESFSIDLKTNAYFCLVKVPDADISSLVENYFAAIHFQYDKSEPLRVSPD